MAKIYLQHPYLSRTNLAVFFALCMIGGFLCSRVLLSLSMILFGINALRGVPVSAWFRQRWWLLGMLWIGMYALSWFWSDDKTFWNERVQTKLPFLLLPLAFGLLPAFSRKQLQWYTICLCLILLSGIGYSLAFLAGDPAAYIEGYTRSHVLPTPTYRDHIRFSMAVALSTGWCLYILPEVRGRYAGLLVKISILVFAVYLHILAAKTGLIAFYILAMMWAFYQIIRRNRIAGIATLALITAGGVLAIRYIPTLSHRVGYSIYSYQQYMQGNISGDLSDVGRMVSYKLAIELIEQHPFTGVGAGDVLSEMSRAYDHRYPHIPQAQRLVPHNQFLTIGVAAGLISLAFFLWWLCAPLSRIRQNRTGFFFFTTWLMLFFFLMTDASLEVQFGVFVFLYFLLWQRHALLSPPAEKISE